MPLSVSAALRYPCTWMQDRPIRRTDQVPFSCSTPFRPLQQWRRHCATARRTGPRPLRSVRRGVRNSPGVSVGYTMAATRAPGCARLHRIVLPSDSKHRSPRPARRRARAGSGTARRPCAGCATGSACAPARRRRHAGAGVRAHPPDRRRGSGDCGSTPRPGTPCCVTCPVSGSRSAAQERAARLSGRW